MVFQTEALTAYDLLFLVSLTSSVFIVSELKKWFERTMERRMYKSKTELDFVWQSMGSVDRTNHVNINQFHEQEQLLEQQTRRRHN